MRDILSDHGDGPRPDPMERARVAMRTPLPRRFYTSAEVTPAEDGFAVHLDGRSAVTPGRSKLILPTEACARMVAEEFAAQGDVIDPATMPVTRLANTAIDGVSADPQAVLEDILRYASSDLTCYRADSPERLVELQSEAWDPVLDWLRSRFGARFVLSEGITHVTQPRESIAVLGAHLAARSEPFRLASLHVMTTLMGSALLAIAVSEGEISPESAWLAAHVDEDWNIAQWGEDAEAAARRAERRKDMDAAARLIAALD